MKSSLSRRLPAGWWLLAAAWIAIAPGCGRHGVAVTHRVTADGVAEIRLQGEASGDLVFAFRPHWSLSREQVAGEAIIAVVGETEPDSAAVHARSLQRLYLLAYPSGRIFVVGMDGSVADTLARHTRGPRAVTGAVDLVRLPDETLGLLRPQPAEVVKLDSSGNLVGRVPLRPVTAGGHVVARRCEATREALVVGGAETHASRAGQVRQHFVRRYDTYGFPRVTYHTRTDTINTSGRVLREADILAPFTLSFTSEADGGVLIAPERDHYLVHHHAPDGRMTHRYVREFAPPPRDAADSTALARLFDFWAEDIPLRMSYEYCAREAAIRSLCGHNGFLRVEHARSQEGADVGGALRIDVISNMSRETYELWAMELRAPAPEGCSEGLRFCTGIDLPGGYRLCDAAEARRIRNGGPADSAAARPATAFVWYGQPR